MRFQSKLFALILVLTTAWTSSLAVESEVQPSYEEARQASWILTGELIEILKKGDAKQWPGTHAWLEDLHEQTKGIGKDTPVAEWPKVEIGELVDHNPNFWRMYFEIAPGDPVLTMIHAGLLLSQGEAVRAGYILEVGQHFPGIPKEILRAFHSLQATTKASRKASNDVTQEGIKLYDQGDYDGAMKKYRQALKLCPQNGWTHYEIGYTIRTQEKIARGEPLLKPGTVRTEGKLHDSPKVKAAFAEARRHDPLEVMSYQSSDPELIKRVIAIVKQVRPAWKALRVEGITRHDEYLALKDLSEGLHEAGVHDLAILARQLMAARRNSYDPEDYPIIAACLRKLAPGEQIEDILSRMAGKTMAFRPLTIQEKEAGQPALGSGMRLYMPDKPQPKTEANKPVKLDYIRLLTEEDDFAKRIKVDDFGKFTEKFDKIADEVFGKSETPCRILVHFTCTPSGHTVKLMHHPQDDVDKTLMEKMYEVLKKMDKLNVKEKTVEFQIRLTVTPKTKQSKKEK